MRCVIHRFFDSFKISRPDIIYDDVEYVIKTGAENKKKCDEEPELDIHRSSLSE